MNLENSANETKANEIKKSFIDDLDKDIIEAGKRFIRDIKKGLYINRHRTVYSPDKNPCGNYCKE